MIDEKELIKYLKDNLRIKQKIIEHFHDMGHDGSSMYTSIYIGDEFITSIRKEL